MAKKTPKERGSELVSQLLPLFSEADRAVVQEKLSTEQVVSLLGEAALRQDDYSREMNETSTLRKNTEKWRTDLGTWKSSVDAELAAAGFKFDETTGKIIKTGGDPAPAAVPGNGDGNQPPDLSGYVRREDFTKTVNDAVNQAQGYATNFTSYMTQLGLSHLKEFDEVLNAGELIAHCRTTGRPVDQGGYESYVHEKREAKRKADSDAALKAAEQRGFERGRQENSTLPYPVSAGDEGTLSGLSPDFKDKHKGVNPVAAAVATYNKAVAEKFGGGGA